MAVSFTESKTKENLMRAFAGESQARNRYTIAAEEAKKKKFQALQQIFLFTADQERAHAARFYELLKPESGRNIQIDGTYPVDHSESLAELLDMASHNEKEEHEKVYPEFARIAKEEGFIEAAAAFSQIAQIEKVHGERFERPSEMLKNETYFEACEGGENKKWMCLNCGHIFEGKKVPLQCSVCFHDRGYFIPIGLAPYFCDCFIAR